VRKGGNDNGFQEDVHVATPRRMALRLSGDLLPGAVTTPQVVAGQHGTATSRGAYIPHRIDHLAQQLYIRIVIAGNRSAGKRTTGGRFERRGK
jgi:hypothetical protein